MVREMIKVDRKEIRDRLKSNKAKGGKIGKRGKDKKKRKTRNDKDKPRKELLDLPAY